MTSVFLKNIKATWHPSQCHVDVIVFEYMYMNDLNLLFQTINRLLVYSTEISGTVATR